VAAFAKTYGGKFPRAVKQTTDGVDELLAFYDFPAERWIHLRTTNPIESTFATVRLRIKVTPGAGSAAAARATVFKLVESAQQRWRDANAPHLRRPGPCRSPHRARPPRRTLREPRGLNDGN
jgi:transposase-like protein